MRSLRYAIPLALALASPVLAAEPTIRSVEVVGTEFLVTRSDSSVLRSADLVGAVLTIAGPDGRPIAVRIDDVERDPKDPEVVLHGFSVRNDATGEWANMCG